MCRAGSRSLDDLDPASMKHPSRSVGLEVAMALFGMVWLLRVRSEMRRCSKCRHEEMLAQQQQQHQQQVQQQHHHHHHHQHHQQQRTLSQATSLLQTMSDDGVSSSANTLFTLDTPGAAGPAGSYCEVHGYVQAKEDTKLLQKNCTKFNRRWLLLFVSRKCRRAIMEKNRFEQKTDLTILLSVAMQSKYETRSLGNIIDKTGDG
ncbi:hypothetical protein ACFW04_000581 [Cataglyphis niger]